MNKEKLDKFIDMIFEEIGYIKSGVGKYGRHRDMNGLINENEELLCYESIREFIVTENVPLLRMLEGSLDEESFRYIMNEVGNILIKLLVSWKTVEYDSSRNMLFKFNYI